jgi:CSLREA domain-containing protein
MGVAAVAAALITLAAPGAVSAQQFPGIFTVNRTADGNDGECNNDCTLREAVSLAVPGQTTSINVPPGVFRLTLGPLVLNNTLLIGPGLVGGQGAGARTTIIDARQRSRVIEVPTGSSSIIAGLTITGGVAPNGGGALVSPEGILNVYNSVIEGNIATARGGGVASFGTVSLQNSTVSGNRVSDGSGGGVAIEADGDGIFLASTISGNSATTAGGGVSSAGNLVLQNLTIAGNTGAGLFQESATGASIAMWNTIVAGGASGGACGGSIAGVPRSQFTHNLATDDSCVFATPTEGTVGDPLLGALRNNGGPTDTRALGAGSPAIDNADPQLCGSPDQRGAQPVGTCDIGAFEFGGRPPQVQLPPPVAGETVNVSRAQGTVKIKLPGSDEFFDLRDGQQVPVGSTFDTSKGRVNLNAAGNQQAWFYDGVFKLRQSKGAKPLSTLRLTGKLNCGGGSANAAARKKKRRLWGDGKGKFRTEGEFSSATVRGTRWLVEDRCNGTLTRVKKGRVAVKYRGRTIILRAGQKFFAKRRR